MEMHGYKLSDEAARSILGGQPRPKVAMNVIAQAVAKARTAAPNTEASPLALDSAAIYATAKFADGVYPEGMALDSCLPSMSGAAGSWAMASLFHEGMGFFGYPYLAELQQRSEYRHAAEIWAEHAVRKWVKIVGSTPDKRKVVEEELTRLNVRDVFQEWMGHDHVFGRGQIFLDFDDADKPGELMVPLAVTDAKISSKRPLQRLTVVEPMWSAPGAYATNNPLRHDFYKPQHWFVYGKRVHTSRMLTLSSRPVSDMLKPAYAFGGQSLTQLMKPYVDNWLRTRQAVSDMLNAYSILVLETDMSSIMGGGMGDSLFNRLDVFNNLRDNRGSMAIDRGNEALTNIAVPLGGLDALQAQAQEQLASVSRIPLSIYLQITPTGLNATNDGETRNFYADVKAYQEKNVRPHLQRVFEIVQLSKLGAIDPEMKFEFVALWEMSDKDKAEIRKADSDADCAYVTSGIVDAEEVRERLSNDETSLYHGVDLTDPPPELPDAEEDDPDDSGPGGKKVAQDGWNEGDHPRDENGKFGSGGGSSESGNSPAPAPAAALAKFKASPTVWTSRASGLEYVANAMPVVPRDAMPRIRAQQEALEDATVSSKGDAFFKTETVSPTELKSLQTQVARKQVLDVAGRGSFNSTDNGELPLAIKGPDGLILVDGNHRANAAILAGKPLAVQVFDFDGWEKAKAEKDAGNAKNNGPDDDELLRQLLG